MAAPTPDAVPIMDFSNDPTAFCYHFAIVTENSTLRIPITGTKISVFDGIVFLTVAIIIMFFTIRLPWSIKRFRLRPKADLQKAYYILMWVSLTLRLIRFILYWTVWNSSESQNIVAMIGWIVLRTLVWAVEVSVLVRRISSLGHLCPLD